LRSVVGDERPIFSSQHGLILTPSKARCRTPERRRILMFGRMEAYKGLELLLDACAHLDSEQIDYTLVLAGRGPELDRLADRIAPLRRVEVIRRFLSVEEAIAEFQKAVFAVMPYLEATQSGVVAAAFANKRPVVATAVGGLVDAIEPGRTGLLVAPNDPVTLADGMAQLLTNETLWHEMRRELEGGLPEFEWSEICSRLRMAYRSIAASHQPVAQNKPL
jgi:glycosyltransferase involved in cell wall biosynthesis